MCTSYLVVPPTGLLWLATRHIIQQAHISTLGSVFWYMGRFFGCRKYRTRNQGTNPIQEEGRVAL